MTQKVSLIGLLVFFISLTSFAQAKQSDSNHLENKKVYTGLAEAFSNPDDVYRLNLTLFEIKKLPKEIYQFQNLHKLDLSFNNIKKLPDSIGELSLLEELDLRFTPIKKLPEKIRYLQNLKKIYVAETNLDEREIARVKRQLPNCQIVYAKSDMRVGLR